MRERAGSVAERSGRRSRRAYRGRRSTTPLTGMEGGGFFPFGGDPEEILRGLREFAETAGRERQGRAARAVRDADAEHRRRADAAALTQVQPTGALDEQAVALRDAMRVLFPEAVALVRPPARASCARAEVDPPRREGRSTAPSPASSPPCRARSSAASRRRTSPARRSTTRGASSPRSTRRGKRATVDVLGEEITTPRRRRRSRRLPRRARRDRRRAARRERLGQAHRPRAEARPRALPVAARGRSSATRPRAGSFVRIDMEDSTCDDDTLALYRALRADGPDNVGIVLQACLKRTLADIAELARPPAERPALQGHLHRAGAIAFQELDVIRASFVSCLDALLERGLHGSRSPRTTSGCSRSALERVAALDAGRYEFQMLLGVRASAASELVAAGPPAARLRPLRAALVRVLAPAAAGEPEGRRPRRARRDRPAGPRPVAVHAPPARPRSRPLRGSAEGGDPDRDPLGGSRFHENQGSVWTTTSATPGLRGADPLGDRPSPGRARRRASSPRRGRA